MIATIYIYKSYGIVYVYLYIYIYILTNIFISIYIHRSGNIFGIMNCFCIEPWVLVCFFDRAPSTRQYRSCWIFSWTQDFVFEDPKGNSKAERYLGLSSDSFLRRLVSLMSDCLGKHSWCFQEFNVQRGPLKNQISRGFDYSENSHMWCFKGGIDIYIWVLWRSIPC